MSEVLDGEFCIGSRPSPAEIEGLATEGFSGILNIYDPEDEDYDPAEERKVAQDLEFCYEEHPIPDNGSPVPMGSLHVAASKLCELVLKCRGKRKGLIYLHCAAGCGRSPTVAAAYLLAKQPTADVDGTLDRIRKARRHPGCLHGADLRFSGYLPEYERLLKTPGFENYILLARGWRSR